ncbi:MAG: 30S ribosomal protein S8 [Candidatus Buchananbacteria bacterium RBG_13_39_9]|uniref:Small ribosomal subunit protein uS8 n=1 Tax=Candidatus Buchananbacteria bacterium RBG_13_39_9 TaxID=1797531 RepID=A0A1G1XNQ7_9BACT|nr:MAG: 30S ribosomal protein S8 [Candidatus Buchananbacteria bacterium RBG_13_39_9]
MITDPIADMLTRIRNAQKVKKQEVLMPFSNLKFEIAKILKHENYVENVEKVSESKFPQIKIVLKYDNDKQPAIMTINRVSKPGQRVYISKNNIPSILNNYGIAIISTSAGLMTNKEARRKGIGGEILCEVW